MVLNSCNCGFLLRLLIGTLGIGRIGEPIVLLFFYVLLSRCVHETNNTPSTVINHELKVFILEIVGNYPR